MTAHSDLPERRQGGRGRPAAPTGPGRPRSDDITLRVQSAARVAFAQRGITAVTMAEIASSAGVGLDSIYRRWSSKQSLLVDVVATAVADEVVVPDTGSLASDLERLMGSLIRAANADLGSLLAAAVAEARHDPELASRLADAQARRRQATTEVVERAVRRHELRPDVDPQILLDALAGIVWQRTWLAGTRMNPAQSASIVGALLDGFVRKQ